MLTWSPGLETIATVILNDYGPLEPVKDRSTARKGSTQSGITKSSRLATTRTRFGGFLVFYGLRVRTPRSALATSTVKLTFDAPFSRAPSSLGYALSISMSTNPLLFALTAKYTK